MAESNARAQRVAERGRRILDAARSLAETDGWGGVTTRRLADAIGYTQPVLYAHFPGGMAEITRAVALSAFGELASAMRDAVGSRSGAPAIVAVAEAYLGFAATHPALYEAMFQLPIGAHFAQEGNEVELRAGFDALQAALGGGDGSTTEVLWGALHGVSQLERAGRMRPEHRPQRIAELAARFAS